MNQSSSPAGVTTDSQLENYYRWVEPDSNITVCLKLDSVDRLQREILRAFDPFARLGNEVGGVLLGRTTLEEGRTLVFVDDFEPVPCEHETMYVLTARDAVNVELAMARHRASDTTSVVGYYRSHNRQGLFLSKDDLQIIQRHFPGPDNLFLLVKTLPNRACTAGFFFWKDGHIQSEFTDSEAPLIPLSITAGIPSVTLGETVDDLPIARPAAAISTVVPAISNPPRTVDRRGLLRGIVVTGVAAAVTFAVLRYQASITAQPVQVRDATIVPLAAAKNPPSPPSRAKKPLPAVKPSAPGVGDLPKTTLSAVVNQNVAPLRDNPSPPPEPATVRSPDVPDVNTPSPLLPVAPPVTHPVPVETPVATPIATSVPPTTPPPFESATTPPPVAETTPRSATPAATPAPTPPPAVAPAHTFIGPHVIHQVSPAVPRGVGSMITTDVQVDVAVVVDAQGKVASARVASTRGAAAGLLTIEVLKAAQLCRFQPAQEDGRNVVSSSVLTFRFARTTK